MSYWGGLTGHAKVNAKNPDPFFVCDRCGQWWNRSKAQWDEQYAGKSLINRRFLVCPTCKDIPQSQLKSLTLPPDPMPLKDVREEPFTADETGNVTAVGGTYVTTEGGDVVFIPLTSS